MNKFNGSPVKGKYDDVVLSAHLDDVLNLPGFNFKKVIMKMDVIQYYVIKYVSDLRKVGGFLRVLQFPPSIKLTATILMKYC
jgi:hypothetical protein